MNIALSLRVTLKIMSYQPGRILVVSHDLGCSEEQRADNLRFSTRLALIFGIAQYFGASGMRIDISSSLPPMSGLGGSGALGVAAVAAFSAASGKRMKRKDIVRLAHLLEGCFTPGHNGIQDQAAAAYGGANLWEWKPFPLPADFRRLSLIPRTHLPELGRRLLVAYCGLDHSAGLLNRSCVENFMQGKRRTEWLELNELTRLFSVCLVKRDWQGACRTMAAETALRRRVMPEVFSPLANQLIRAAEKVGGAGRFTGAGGGGSVWALCEPDALERLSTVWQRILESVSGAKILVCKPEGKGIILSQEEQ